MKSTLRNVILSLVVLSSLFISCESIQDRTKLTEKVTESQEEKILNSEEQEIKAIVEKLLMLAGNSDFQGLDSIVSDKANLGSAIIQDGVSENSVITIGEYFEAQKNRERKPFYEPVNEYKILINKGQVAFVWADATLHSYGVPRTNNIDNFTLIKEDFAKSYAQVWCSQRPNFVSSFFSEDGVLQINDGSPARGTEAITNVAKGFMDAFPDMIVSMDSLITKSEKTRFYWTLTGTNNGTRNKVNISGYEEWIINKGLIQKSKGYFDEKEYQRQLEFGTDK